MIPSFDYYSLNIKNTEVWIFILSVEISVTNIENNLPVYLDL